MAQSSDRRNWHERSLRQHRVIARACLIAGIAEMIDGRRPAGARRQSGCHRRGAPIHPVPWFLNSRGLDRHAARSRYVQIAKIAAPRDFELEMHQSRPVTASPCVRLAGVEFDSADVRSLPSRTNGSKTGVIGSFGDGSGVIPAGVALCRRQRGQEPVYNLRRRCRLQSRSPRTWTLPCRSAATWTSTWQ